jgi:hypothetical protein
MKTRFHSLVFAAGILGATGFTLQADPALLGHKGLASQKLDADAAKAVLLGKKATLGSDRVIIVIIKKSEAQEAFLKNTVGMTTDQLQTYWRRLFMTGGGSAPKVVETEAEGLKLVAETPGAVVVGEQANAGDLTVLTAK